MRNLEDEILAQRIKEMLDEELNSALLPREVLAGFKRAALKRPLSLRWQQFLERETQISITAIAACFLIIVTLGGFAADIFLRVDPVPATPITLRQNGAQQTWNQPEAGRGV
jgi:hypothetical protein